MNDLEIRRSTPADRPRVLSLLRRSLGWGDDPRYEELFAWKHDANPFGASPAWVAQHGERVVGFRTFMRWEFQLDGETIRAVRAVDTATDPEYQGRGVFRRLTLHALDEIGSERVDFVFNTPNRASRPGYLRMGWQELGRLPVRVQPRGLRGLARLVRARVPAEHWPIPGRALPGAPAAEALADAGVIDALCEQLADPRGLSTRRTPAFLAWRYGLAVLGYRALLVGDAPGDGLVLFRVRRRPPAVEVAILDAVVPAGPSAPTGLTRRLLGDCGADHAIAIGTTLPGGHGIPLPRQGPVLTWRALARSSVPPLGGWSLSLGDVELF